MWYMQVGVYIHNCACALVLPIYWLEFEILIVSDYCSQISHGKKKEIINFQHFGCIIYVYSRAFDCVSQRTSYLID